MPSTRSLLAKGLLVLAGLLFALLAAELGLRLFKDVTHLAPDGKGRRAGEWSQLVHRASDVPGLAYELAPGLDVVARGMRVRTNSLGQRGPEPLPRDTPGLVRILALGDSLTFGYGVEQAQAWPALLERALAEPAGPRRCEVLNLGVSGYSSADEVRAFEAKGLALEPDLVLLAYCLNDPELEPRQPLQRHFARPALWHHSTLLRWCSAVLRNERMKRRAGNDFFRFLHLEDGEDWRSVERSFARLRELCSGRAAPPAPPVPVVVVIFPMLQWKDWSSYALADVHAQVAAEAERNGFFVLDLLEAFSRLPQPELMLTPDDMHPNPRGHELACAEIARFLEAHPQLAQPRRR